MEVIKKIGQLWPNISLIGLEFQQFGFLAWMLKIIFIALIVLSKVALLILRSYRPINLVNDYKILATLLASILKAMLDKLNNGAFVRGRLILD